MLLSILAIHFLVEAARRQYAFVPNLEKMRYWLFYPSFQVPFRYHVEIRPHFWLLKHGLLYPRLTLNLLVAKDHLEVLILLPPPPPYWDGKCAPPGLAFYGKQKQNLFDHKTL